MATVVLLHPFPQDSAFWHEVAEAVRAAGHEVLTPDLPGFGARGVEPGWTMAGEADRLAEQIPAGSAVVGLSMGGYLALALLAAHPDRVGSLVLADTRASAEAPEFQERVVQVSRVTKVCTGGKQLSFRAVVVVGDEKGQVRIGEKEKRRKEA